MKITSAESLVMDVLWRSGPKDAEEITAALADEQGWTETTVRTLLARLADKKAVARKKEGRRYLFAPLIERVDYTHFESRTLVDRLFGGKLGPLVAQFSERQDITDDDLAELKAVIARIEMAAEILTALLGANIAMAGAILAVLVLRAPVRALAGARLAYGLWAIVPLAGLASLLPARPAAQAVFSSVSPQPMAQAAMEAVLVQMQVQVQAPAGAAVDSSAMLAAVWLLGAAITALAFLLRQRRALRLIGQVTPQGPGLARAQAPDLGPAVIGVLFPRIVLPADFEARFDAREQALILAHEEAHLAGWDVRINAAALLVCCLGWFNPLLHLAAWRLRADQELACDEAVVARFPGARRAYANALLKTQIAAASLPLGCTWPARSSQRLKERLVMLTKTSPGQMRRLMGASLVATLAGTASYTAWAAEPQATEAVQTVVAPVVRATVAPMQRRSQAAPRPAAPTVSASAPTKPAAATPAMTWEEAFAEVARRRAERLPMPPGRATSIGADYIRGTSTADGRSIIAFGAGQGPDWTPPFNSGGARVSLMNVTATQQAQLRYVETAGEAAGSEETVRFLQVDPANPKVVILTCAVDSQGTVSGCKDQPGVADPATRRAALEQVTLARPGPAIIDTLPPNLFQQPVHQPEATIAVIFN